MTAPQAFTLGEIKRVSTERLQARLRDLEALEECGEGRQVDGTELFYIERELDNRWSETYGKFRLDRDDE
jgi:hypothetical protein